MTSSLWLYTPSGLTNCITNMSVFSVGRLVDPGMNDLPPLCGCTHLVG